MNTAAEKIEEAEEDRLTEADEEAIAEAARNMAEEAEHAAIAAEAEAAIEAEVDADLKKVSEIAKEAAEKAADAARESVKAKELEEAKDVPKGPVFVTEVDKLKAENINLRLLDATNRETIAHLALQEATRNKQIANDAAMAMRGKLEEQYKVDFNTHLIDEVTGEVRVRPGVNLQALQAIKAAQEAQAKAQEKAAKATEENKG